MSEHLRNVIRVLKQIEKKEVQLPQKADSEVKPGPDKPPSPSPRRAG